MTLHIHYDTAERVKAALYSHDNESKNPHTLKMTETDFFNHIFMLGLLDYEYRIQPKITGKPYKPYKAKRI